MYSTLLGGQFKVILPTSTFKITRCRFFHFFFFFFSYIQLHVGTLLQNYWLCFLYLIFSPSDVLYFPRRTVQSNSSYINFQNRQMPDADFYTHTPTFNFHGDFLGMTTICNAFPDFSCCNQLKIGQQVQVWPHENFWT